MTLVGFTDEEKRERHKHQQKVWRTANKEHKQLLDKRWRDKHKEMLLERARLAYYKKKHMYDDSILSYALALPERVS